MTHVFERASTGRAKCRGCKEAIAKDEVRFGEKLPNPFGEGEVTHWFHPACAAYKRPQQVIDALDAGADAIVERGPLEAQARASLASPRLPRIDGAERAPSGQAKCRQCHAPIERSAWRLRLTLHEEGTFSPGGYVHLACRRDYFGAEDITAHVLHFTRALEAAELDSLRAELSA